MEDSKDELFDIANWDGDVEQRKRRLFQYLDSKSPAELAKCIVTVLDTYFSSVLEEHQMDDIDYDPDYVNSEVVLLMLKNFLFPWFPPHERAMTTRQLLFDHHLRRVFATEDKLYELTAVYDCMFGDLFNDNNSELAMMKLTCLSRLMSSSISTQAKMSLQAFAVLLPKLGSHNTHLVTVTNFLSRDFCETLPQSSAHLIYAVRVSPHFTGELLKAFLSNFDATLFPAYADFRNCRLPPPSLIGVIADWLLLHPRILFELMSESPPSPSMHRQAQGRSLQLEPLLCLLCLTLALPWWISKDSSAYRALLDPPEEVGAKLHYAFLNSLEAIKKRSKGSGPDNQEIEQGELTDDEDSDDMHNIRGEHWQHAIALIRRYRSVSSDPGPLDISMEYLASIVQIAYASGCTSFPVQTLQDYCSTLPSHMILTKVLHSLKFKSK